MTTKTETRKLYAGQLRTREQIERRRAWKRQHGDNAKRIFVGSMYIGMEHAFPYPRQIVEAHIRAKLDKFRAKQAAERQRYKP